MFRGDISNHNAPTIVIDMDSLLYVEPEEEKSFIKRVVQSILVKKVFNEDLLNILSFIWHKYDVSIYLVTFNIKDDDKLNDIYEQLVGKGVAITDIVYHTEWEDVLYRLGNGVYTYFFSANTDIISYLGRNAYHISQYREVL